MQEIAPGGFQIMWSASALLKTWRSASGERIPSDISFSRKCITNWVWTRYAELGVIDLTKIVGLKSLNISGCTSMNNIDITANEKLETLSATGTSLEVLDVSKDFKLSKLDLSTSVMLLVSVGMNSSIYQVGQYLSTDDFLGVVFFNEASVVKAVSVDETETIYGYYQKILS